jgi:hypothetical protein
MLRKYIAMLFCRTFFLFRKRAFFYTTFLTVYTHVHFLILTVQRSFAVFTFTSQEFNLHILFSFFPWGNVGNVAYYYYLGGLAVRNSCAPASKR